MTLTESMRVRDRVRAWKRESMTLARAIRHRGHGAQAPPRPHERPPIGREDPLRRLHLALHHAHRGQVDLRSALRWPEPHCCEGGALQRLTRHP